MRRPHVLRRNKNCEMPHEAIWVDTETSPEIQPDGSERHVLDFGYAAYSRTRNTDEWIEPQWLRFTTIEQFWEWALSRLHGKSKLNIFAHNWAFDAPVLDTFNVLPDEGYKLTGSVIQSPPVILKWRKKPHTISMIDTLNIWRMPLKKLGQSIGLPKLEMPPRGAPIEDWNAYGKRDTEIIMEACFRWWQFLKDNDLGGFAATLAAQSIRTYRHKFMSHQILIDDNEKALTLARESLHGGRTECFYIGKVKHKVYKLDINSEYPSVMQKEMMPRKLVGHYKNIAIDDIKSWLKFYCITAKCVIETSEAVFPVVQDKKLIFPVGTFEAVLSTPEIRYALKHKLIKKVTECNIYEKAVLFKKYINYFYQYRRECIEAGNEVDAANAKMLLTNLYGKFAQKGTIYKKEYDTAETDIKVWTELDAETGEIYNYRQYAKIVEVLERETESRDSHPAIAAHITAHARMLLWGLMQRCGQGNYVYCDTDSLWTNKAGYERLEAHCHDTELGKLKLEGVHDDVTIYGAKDYIVDGSARIKGIRATAEKIDEHTFKQVKFTTLIGLLRKGDLSAPLVSQVTKHLQRQYTKGIVDNKGDVKPIRLASCE